MKVAIVGDLHARGKDLDQLLAQAEAAGEVMKVREVELVIQAGDVFDRANIGDGDAPTGTVVKAARDAMNMIRPFFRTPMVAVAGNHDMPGAGGHDALQALENERHLNIVREARTVGKIALLPWSWDWTRSAEDELRRICAEPVDLLVGHVEVVGARMSGSACCEPRPGRWQVSRALLEELPVRRIALGHFHARQDLTGGRGGYVGALRQLNHGEEGNPAGFEIFDTCTGNAEWFEVGAAKRYKTVVVMPGEPVPPVNGDILRVRFEAAPTGEEVRRLEAAGAKIEVMVETQERARRAEVPDGVVGDPDALLGLWAAAQEPPMDGARLTAAREELHNLLTGGAK